MAERYRRRWARRGEIDIPSSEAARLLHLYGEGQRSKICPIRQERIEDRDGVGKVQGGLARGVVEFECCRLAQAVGQQDALGIDHLHQIRAKRHDAAASRAGAGRRGNLADAQADISPGSCQIGAGHRARWHIDLQPTVAALEGCGMVGRQRQSPRLHAEAPGPFQRLRGTSRSIGGLPLPNPAGGATEVASAWGLKRLGVGFVPCAFWPTRPCAEATGKRSDASCEIGIRIPLSTSSMSSTQRTCSRSHRAISPRPEDGTCVRDLKD